MKAEGLCREWRFGGPPWLTYGSVSASART